MVTCECGTKVKTKYCPNCGKKLEADNMVLKWISSCETSQKYWRDKLDAIDPSDTKAEKLKEKGEKMLVMWTKRISILKDCLARDTGTETE